MLRQIVILFIVAVILGKSDALCPALIRVFNGANPANPTNVDLIVNSKIIVTGVPFGQASRYFAAQPGTLNVLIRQSGTLNTVGIRSFTGVANNAYTVAVTGLISAPIGTLLVDTTPFVFNENLLPPSLGKFRGVIHALSEMNDNSTLEITGPSSFEYIPLIQPKTAVAYPETVIGQVSFSVYNSTGFLIVGSQNNTIQINTTLTNGLIYDLFIVGDDSTSSFVFMSAVTYAPYFDPNSGCILVDGALVLPDTTPFIFPTLAPCPTNASSITLIAGFSALLCLALCLLF